MAKKILGYIKLEVPAGPMGGEGVAAPAGTSSLMYPRIFLAIGSVSYEAAPAYRSPWPWCGQPLPRI